MSAPEKLIPCPGCGAKFRDCEGATHRYMESSPGCWEAYGEVLAREYNDRSYFKVHRLTVDAYAVQHPGHPSRQSIHSVGVHLIRLCLFLERGLTAEHANEAMLAAGKNKHSFVWLKPPASLGEITVQNVIDERSVEAHTAAVQCWAESAWKAWSPHHPTIYGWLPKL